MVDKGLARGGVGRVPEGEDLEDAVAGLPPESGSGEHELPQRSLQPHAGLFFGVVRSALLVV